MQTEHTRRGMLVIQEPLAQMIENTQGFPKGQALSEQGIAILDVLGLALGEVGFGAPPITSFEIQAPYRGGWIIRFFHEHLPCGDFYDPPILFTVTHDADGYHVAQGAEG